MKVCLALTLAGGAALAQNPDWNALGKHGGPTFSFLPTTASKAAIPAAAALRRPPTYMAEQFRAAGLEPAGVDGYRQPMDFQVVKIDESRCSLDLLRDGKAQPVKLGDDAMLGVSSHAAENVEAGAVFVGYGLTVPESPLRRSGRPGREGQDRGPGYGRPERHARPGKSALPIRGRAAEGAGEKQGSSARSPSRIPRAPRCPGRASQHRGSSHAWN